MALAQGGADGVARGNVARGFVEIGIAEPGPVAAPSVQPLSRLIDIGDERGGADLAQMRVAVAVIADDMAGADIGGDLPLAAGAPGLLQIAGIEEEGGLAHARPPQRRDQPLGALLRGHEGAGRAGHIVEGEGDPLLRRGRRGKSEESGEEQKKARSDHGASPSSWRAARTAGRAPTSWRKVLSAGQRVKSKWKTRAQPRTTNR